MRARIRVTDAALAVLGLCAVPLVTGLFRRHGMGPVLFIMPALCVLQAFLSACGKSPVVRFLPTGFMLAGIAYALASSFDILGRVRGWNIFFAIPFAAYLLPCLLGILISWVFRKEKLRRFAERTAKKLKQRENTDGL